MKRTGQVDANGKIDDTQTPTAVSEKTDVQVTFDVSTLPCEPFVAKMYQLDSNGDEVSGDVTDHNEKSVVGRVSTYSNVYLRNVYTETPSNNMPLSPVTWIEDDDDEDGTGKSFAPLIEFTFFIVVIIIVGLVAQLVLGNKESNQVDVMTARSNEVVSSPKSDINAPHASKDEEGVIDTTKA